MYQSRVGKRALKITYKKSNNKKEKREMSRVPPSARMETHSLSHSVASDSNESLSLKLQLQESLLKLEERNLLLGKAKSAMELLSNEVSRLRLENKEKTIHNEKMVRIIKGRRLFILTLVLFTYSFLS